MMKELDAGIIDLQTKKKQLIEILTSAVEMKWKALCSEDEIKAHLLSIDEADWTCVACTTNFTPMILADTSVKAHEFLYHCESCGGAVCFKCTTRMLTLNAHNDRSIGVNCPICRFYNCNRIKKDVIQRPLSIEKMAFPSGYSTIAPNKVKGDKLPTELGVTSNENHEKNIQERREVFDLLSESNNSNGMSDIRSRELLTRIMRSFDNNIININIPDESSDESDD
jgi:hypothetical protein